MLDKMRALPIPLWILQLLLPLLASWLISGAVSRGNHDKATTVDIAVVATKVEGLTNTMTTMQEQTNRIEMKLDKFLLIHTK